MRKFLELPDGKLELHTPENGSKGIGKKLILYQQWLLDWKDLLSSVAGGKTMCLLSDTLVHSPTHGSRLC